MTAIAYQTKVNGSVNLKLEFIRTLNNEEGSINIAKYLSWEQSLENKYKGFV
jgi:hypothetical protein